MACVPAHPPAPAASTRATPAIHGPASVSLGSLRHGEGGRASFVLRNTTDKAVELRSASTTCPCVSISPVPSTIGPGSSAELIAAFDPAEEPDFSGRLGVDVVGKDEAGRELFRLEIDVEVLPSPRIAPPSRSM